MLISSMDQLSYYSVPKDGYLEIDTRTGGYAMGQATMVVATDDASAAYANEENSPKNGTKSSLYKTELCKRFSEFGSCRYGAKCQFAHGIAELRHVVRHPKYKTTKCKSYWGSGHCPYGSRCRFIHEETESLTQQPQYSPPPTGAYLHDKSAMQFATSGMAMSPNTGYLYGSDLVAPNAAEHVGVSPGGLPVYQDEYAAIPPFEKSASAPWGLGGPSQSQSRLRYGEQTYSSVKQTAVPSGLDGMVSPPAGTSAASVPESGFPDLQDAIDALVKFSLSPSDKEQVKPRPSSMDSINTTPIESLSTVSTATTSAHTSGSDFTLEPDDMWKHFPSLATDSSVDFAENEWPTGVSLSLEATGLFGDAEQEGTPPSSTTPKSKKGETSPRLSVFERFH